MDSGDKARTARFRDVSPERGKRDARRDEPGRDDRREGRREARPGRRDEPRREGRREEGGREGGFSRGFRDKDRDLQTLLDLDKDILRLLARRASLLAAMRANDKLDSATEKKLRMGWEEGCLKVSRNPRLARDMFSLMQSLEPAPREEGRGSFTLAPQRLPVEVNLAAPRSSVLARICMMMAAASGRALNLHHVTLSDPVVEAVKAFNQIGAELRWEDEGRVHCPSGKGLKRGADRVVHVGDDFFTLALVLAFSLGMPMRLKLTGNESLRFANLGSLRHFLPALGARLTHVIPGQEGLPVRVECSGMLPDVIEIPKEVPPAFVLALLCAAPFWEKETALRLSQGHAQEADLENLLPELQKLGLKLEARQDEAAQTWNIVAKPGCDLPLSPELPADAPLCSYLLALPAFAGGKVRLAGRCMGQPKALAEVLHAVGLSLECGEETLISEKQGQDVAGEKLFTHGVGRQLYPLAVALAARQALLGKPALLPLACEEVDSSVVLSFLAALGLEEGEGGALRKVEASPLPWLSPDAEWCMAYALCAFTRPGLRLANPFLMNSAHPQFWNMYNSLPKPDFKKAVAAEIQDDKPVRRRIIAEGVFGELPPEQPADDEY